jgi:hypothetical protein
MPLGWVGNKLAIETQKYEQAIGMLTAGLAKIIAHPLAPNTPMIRR